MSEWHVDVAKGPEGTTGLRTVVVVWPDGTVVASDYDPATGENQPISLTATQAQQIFDLWHDFVNNWLPQRLPAWQMLGKYGTETGTQTSSSSYRCPECGIKTKGPPDHKPYSGYFHKVGCWYRYNYLPSRKEMWEQMQIDMQRHPGIEWKIRAMDRYGALARLQNLWEELGL